MVISLSVTIIPKEAIISAISIGDMHKAWAVSCVLHKRTRANEIFFFQTKLMMEVSETDVETDRGLLCYQKL